MDSNKSKLLIAILLISRLLISQQLTTIAVLDFEGLGITEVEAKALTDRFRTNLVKSGAYHVIERGKMQDILNEQGFQLSGCTSEECVIEAGQLLGVEKMLAGSISLVGKTYSVGMRLIDVRSGKIEKSEAYDMRGEIDQLLTDGMENAVNLLLDLHVYKTPQQVEIQPVTGQQDKAVVKSGFIDMVLVKAQGSIQYDFYISCFELTQDKWMQLLGSDNPSHFKGANRPVESVSYYEAVNFCNLLSEYEGLSPCYSINETNVDCDFNKNGYRLPTKDEWLYAAKGGFQSGNTKYAGSNILSPVGWFNGNSKGQTHPVGLKMPNKLHIYDMSGNVWEWCWDSKLCGGSWYENEHLNRLTNVIYDDPNKKRNRVGFRICQTADR